jgi:hypothetical protein
MRFFCGYPQSNFEDLIRINRNQAGFLVFDFLLVRKFEIRNQKLETNPKSECFNDQNNIRTQRLTGHVPVFVIRIFVIRFCFGFRFSIFGFSYLIELSVFINFLPQNTQKLQLKYCLKAPIICLLFRKDYHHRLK